MHTTVLHYGWGASIFFIEIICIGNFLLLNLFLAILLKNVEEESTSLELSKKTDYTGLESIQTTYSDDYEYEMKLEAD
jgi:hypothetical protein